MNYQFGDKVFTNKGQWAVIIRMTPNPNVAVVIVEGMDSASFLALDAIQARAGEKPKTFLDFIRGDKVSFQSNEYTIAAVFKKHFVIGTWELTLTGHPYYYDKIRNTYFLKVPKETVIPISSLGETKETNNSRFAHLLTEN